MWERICRLSARAGTSVTEGLKQPFESYLEILTRWNRAINLTGLSLEPLSDVAIDVLLVEPLVAARLLAASDRVLVDIGSGGGSPAIPLKIIIPHLKVVLVESRGKKAAFLREVVRELGLSDVEVENRRYQDVVRRPDLAEAVDVVTVRAVRADLPFWLAVQGLLKVGGRALWFAASDARAEPQGALSLVSVVPLVRGRSSRLILLRKDG